MQDYLIVNAVAGDLQYNLEPKFIGRAALRNSTIDTPQERAALKKSCQENNDPVDLEKSMRLSIIVTADSIEDAFSFARQSFSETLDIWSAFGSFIGQSVRLTNCAFSIDMSTNEIHPYIIFRIPMNCVVCHAGLFQPVTFPQMISVYDDDFTKRIRRFCHWLRKAYTEEDRQLKILFWWFSLEAILKECESDNIAPNIAMLIGFCATKKAPNDWALLRENKNYGEFHRFFVETIDKIRKFRNDSVHSGFVPWDISDDDIKLYLFVLNSASARVRIALKSYYINSNRLKNVRDFKSFLEKIFQFRIIFIIGLMGLSFIVI